MTGKYCDLEIKCAAAEDILYAFSFPVNLELMTAVYDTRLYSQIQGTLNCLVRKHRIQGVNSYPVISSRNPAFLHKLKQPLN